jgi:hypothetical protein
MASRHAGCPVTQGWTLAFTWKAQGQSAEAVALMRQCVQQRQRVLKANIPPCGAENPAEQKLRTTFHHNKVINHLQPLQFSGYIL